MRALLDGLRELFERLNAVALASCGACGSSGSGAAPLRERTRLEPSLARLFTVRPLTDGDSEAIKATQRGSRLLQEGRVEESLRELHDAKRLVPRSQVAWCNLGSAYFERGDEDAALHWFREAHRLSPQDETATLALALLEQRCHQLADAQWLLVNFLQEVDPAHPGALRQLARLHQQQGQWQQAASCFRRLVAVEPSNSEWPRELQTCLERTSGGASARPPPPGGRPDHEHHQQRGGDYGGGGQWATAPPPGGGGGGGGGDWATVQPAGPSSGLRRRDFDDPLDRSGAHGRSHARDGGGAVPGQDRFGCAGGHEAAGSHYERGAGGGGYDRGAGGYDRGPLDRSGHGDAGGRDRGGYGGQGPGLSGRGAGGGGGAAPDLQEAAGLRDAGRLEAALAAYRSVLRVDRTNAEALLGVADCLHDLGQHDSAIEAGKQLLNLKPDDPEAGLRVAELLLSTGRPAYMAEPYLQRASAAPSGELRSRYLCAAAEAALATDDFKKALTSASEAVRLDAADPRALVVLATARIHVADYEASLRTLGAALSLLEGRRSAKAIRLCATAHMLSAQAQERLRQYPQALDEVQQALSLDPRLDAARVVRATALQQCGRDRDAHAELQELLRQNPQNVPARLLLGYLQLSAGDKRAVATLEGAVAGSPAPRSVIGAAKVYLALALDTERRAGGGGAGLGRRAEEALKEGLALHKNLQVVWRDVERTLLEQPPTMAVQRLRGICDLDLTSMQARLLLKLLVRCTGRTDLMRALGFSENRSGTATPEMLRSSTPGSRANSVPPSRYAPESGDRGSAIQRKRSGSPWHGQREAAASGPHSPSGGHGNWGGGGGNSGAPSVAAEPGRRQPISRPLSPSRGMAVPSRGMHQPGPRHSQGAWGPAMPAMQQPPPAWHLQQQQGVAQQGGLQQGGTARGRPRPGSLPQTPLETPYRGRSQEPQYRQAGVLGV